MKKFLLLIIPALILSGCFTAKNLPKHNDKFPLAASGYAATKWPCIPGDTTIVTTTDSLQYMEAISDLLFSLDWINDVNDSLVKELINYKDAGHTDTSCRKFAPIVKSQADKIKQLQYEIEHIPPVFVDSTIYVPYKDSAEAVHLRLSLAKEQGEKQKIQTKLSDTKNKLTWWMIACLITWALILLYIIIKIKIGKVK